MKQILPLVCVLTLLSFSVSAQSVWEFDFSPSVQNEKVFYDSTLWADFVAESEIVDVISRLQHLNVSVNSTDNILVFRDFESVESFYDSLIAISDYVDSVIENNRDFYKYSVADSFPIFPALFLFDITNNFTSLRSAIELQMLHSDYDDNYEFEDEHYIVSDYMQNILNPQCAFAVGNDIILIGEQYTVNIPDMKFNNLSNVLSFWNNFGEFRGTYFALREGIGYDISESYRGDDNADSCGSNTIIVTPIKDICRGYRFKLQHTGNSYVDSTIWRFGDGVTSTFPEPTHTYASPGNYEVTLKIVLSNSKTCYENKTIKVTECNAKIISVQDKDSVGLYKFGANVSTCDSTAEAIGFEWNFGDNSEISRIEEPEHRFSHDATYKVIVKVTFSNGCIAYDTLKVTVNGTGVCCRSKNVKTNTAILLPNGYKVIHKLSKTNRRVIVKLIHQKKKDNGKWKREKAAYLWCNFAGEVYSEENCINLINKIPAGHLKKDAKHNTYDYGMGQKISLLNNSLYTKYKVYTEQESDAVSSNKGLELHKLNCGQ